MTRQECEQGLKALAKSAFKVLLGRPMPTEFEERWIESDSPSPRKEKQRVARPRYLVDSAAHELAQLSEFVTLRDRLIALPEFVTRSKTFATGANKEEAVKAAAFVFLCQFLSTLIDLSKGLSLVESACDALVQAITQHLWTTLRRVRVIVPLLHLRSDLTEVALQQGVKIVGLKPWRAAALSEQIGLELRMGSRADFSHAIVFDWERDQNEKVDEQWDDRVRSTWVAVVSALRVLRRGYLDAPDSIETPRDWPLMDTRTIGHWARGYHTQPYLDYVMSAEVAAALPAMLQNVLSATKGDRALDVAIRRFTSAIGEHHHEDKLIDLLIAAEALFLGDGEPELKHRFAERVALLLETEINARRSIYHLAKQAYDLRSKLVHGAAVDNTAKFKRYQEGREETVKMPLPDFVEDVEILMRRGLNKILSIAPEQRPSKRRDFWEKLSFDPTCQQSPI